MKRKIILLVALSCGIYMVNIAQSLPTAEKVLEQLKEGNKRFVEGKMNHEHQNQERRTETNEHGQHPIATIIGCSDSRVPVEEVFDMGIGDLFVIRVAGNVIAEDEAGSVEYGVHHLHTPLFVVLGHSSCGAVTAVAQNAELHGNIPKLVDNIEPAVAKAHHEHGNEFSEDLLNSAIKHNVFQSIEDLFKSSHVSAELVKEGKLKVVGAVYHLDTGKVEWLGEHPKQNELLKK